MNVGFPPLSPVALGLALRQARRSRTLTQKALAQKSSLDLATIGALEAGRATVPSLITAMTALQFRFLWDVDAAGIGPSLLARRRALRMTQEQLAAAAHVSRPTIIQLRRGKGHVESLCSVLGVLGLPLSLCPWETQAETAPTPSVHVHPGDCLTVLRTFPAQSVHSCITSPPYFQQRDYGIVGQIGLEADPDEYIGKLVDVFREVRRVLRKDGTLWLNIGDAFAKIDSPAGRRKDLLGLPWRLAFAMQQDGWYLRQDIVVQKTNPMPEPVRDRCARAHEYLLLFAIGHRYHFNAEAIRERGVTMNPGSAQRNTRDTHGGVSGGNTGLNAAKRQMRDELHQNGYVTRHKRSVWTVAGARNRHGHYAAFPEAMVEPCILAGCPEGGTVLDPFAGSGTVGRVAKRLGRSADLIEINPEYAELARKRCA